MAIAKERGDKECETRAHIELGHTYRENKHVKTAIDHFQKALKIAREKEDHVTETKAYILLGYSYMQRNQIQIAIKYYKKVSELAREQKIRKLKQTRTSG